MCFINYCFSFQVLPEPNANTTSTSAKTDHASTEEFATTLSTPSSAPVQWVSQVHDAKRTSTTVPPTPVETGGCVKTPSQDTHATVLQGSQASLVKPT